MSFEINHTDALLSSATMNDPVKGYCWPISASPDQSIEFFISAANNYNLEYVRLTDLDANGSGTPLISLGEQTALVQPFPDTAWRDGCGWKMTSRLTVPTNWPSGVYAARLTSTGVTNPPLAFIVFVVKPREHLHGDYLLLAHTLTWNAYNTWGGRSRYEPDAPNTFLLSFLRPKDIYNSPIHKNEHLLHAELWIIKWMQEEGHQVDVVTDHDFHSGIPMLDQYASIILNTHPEYWTQTMIDHLKEYLNVGGCLLYLGGNGLFERVGLDSEGRTQIFHGGASIPNSNRAKQYFRNLNPPQPERELLGVAFLYDGYESTPSPYAVLLPDHRFFNGTGVVLQSKIGAGGRSGGASGLEMDSSRAGDAPPGKIVDAWINHKEDGSPGTDRGNPPPNLQVLARGTNEQVDKQGQHAAEMTYYDTETGGFVFSVGSMTFGGSLVVDTNLQKIVNNALHESLLVRLKRFPLPPGLPSVIPSVLLLI